MMIMIIIIIIIMVIILRIVLTREGRSSKCEIYEGSKDRETDRQSVIAEVCSRTRACISNAY